MIIPTSPDHDAAVEPLSLRPWSNRQYAGPFSLGQSYATAGSGDEFIIPFILSMTADVQLDVFDVEGRKALSIRRKGLSAGPQSIRLNLSGLNLRASSCEYQLQTTSSHGIHRQRRPML